MFTSTTLSQHTSGILSHDNQAKDVQSGIEFRMSLFTGDTILYIEMFPDSIKIFRINKNYRTSEKQ